MNPKFIFIRVKDDLDRITNRYLNVNIIREVVEIKGGSQDGAARIVLLDGSIMTTSAVDHSGNTMFDYIGAQLNKS